MAGFGFCGYETITLVYNSEISGKKKVLNQIKYKLF